MEVLSELYLEQDSVKKLAVLANTLADAQELALCPYGLQGSVSLAIFDSVRDIESIRNPNCRPFSDDRRQDCDAGDMITLAAIECLFAVHDNLIRAYKWEPVCGFPAGRNIEIEAGDLNALEEEFSDPDRAHRFASRDIEHLRKLSAILANSASRDNEPKEVRLLKDEVLEKTGFERFASIKERIADGTLLARVDPRNNRYVFVNNEAWEGIKAGTLNLRARNKVSSAAK